MLALSYVALRFIHFAALMLLFGNALYSVWFAPSSLQRLMTRRFQRQQKLVALISLMAALLMFGLQSGLMGNGWGDVIRPAVWRSVLGTQFGGVWLWQMVLAAATAGAAWLTPQKGSRLLLLVMGQLVLLAGVGHAAMNGGAPGALHRLNHALHLLCAATSGGWFTAAAVLYASGERPLAASRYLYHDALLPRGALRRGRRAADRDNQYALYCWQKRAVACALCPAVVVQMCAGHDDGGNCAGESVFSCATLSPGGRAGTTDFYQDDTGRGGAGRAGTGGRQPVRDLGNPSDKVK